MLTVALLLQVLAAAPTQLTLDVKPAGVEVSLDGRRLGVSHDAPFIVPVKAGRHRVRLRFKGDTHEEEVRVKGGEKATWAWSFSTGPAPTDALTTD